MLQMSLFQMSSGWLAVTLVCAMGSQSGGQDMPQAGQVTASVKSPCRDKSARTPAQRKISSQLLCAIYPPEPPGAKPRLRTDDQGRVLVDIRAKVTDKLVACVAKMGGKVVSHSERYNSIQAYVPLTKLEKLAGLRQITSIRPAAEAATN